MPVSFDNLKNNVAMGLFALLVMARADFAKGLHVEDWIATGTDALGYHLFLNNPAISYDSANYISILALRGSRTESVVGSPDGGAQNISYRSRLESLGAGVLLPMGGAAAGFHILDGKEELTASSDVFNRNLVEVKKHRDLAMRFVVQLTGSLRAAFLYQLRNIDYSVYGSFSLGVDDVTRYKGRLSGYRLGLLYEHSNFNLGLYTAPPLRGKSQVSGEEKILTEPGSAGADISIDGKNGMHFGFGLTRWYYKLDDRVALSTSPQDQRNMSLNGLALRQYLRKTDEFRLGASYEFRDNTSLALHLGHGKAVFLFDDDAVPGDRPQRETGVSLRQYILSLQFDKGQFAIDFSYYIESVSQGEISDPSRKLGHNRYGDYSSNQNATVLSFSMKQ